MKTQNIVPVFQVSNLEAALKHYIEVLGFAEDFRYDDYAGIKLRGAALHLCAHTVHNRPLGGGAAYVFCDEVDSYYAEIQSKGANLKSEPKNYDYGMRDFEAVDPDGNHIGFGCPARI